MMEFETLATGYGLLEGPRTDEQNRLYFSDVRGGGAGRDNGETGRKSHIVQKRADGRRVVDLANGSPAASRPGTGG